LINSMVMDSSKSKWCAWTHSQIII